VNTVAEAVIASVRWEQLRAGPGSAAGVPAAFGALATAETDDAATDYYWQLDNVVIVQGNLYESALPAVWAVFALLAGPLPGAARYRLVELLAEIAGGDTAQAETDAGNADLADRCRAALRDGLWTCYALLNDGDPRVRGAAVTLLGWLEDRTEVIVPVLERVATADPEPDIRTAAADLRTEN
jgi:hypothetical protein